MLDSENGEQSFNLTRINGTYGFTVTTQKHEEGTYTHTLINLKSDGAAEKAGVKDKMTLIAINGELCETMNSEEVVNLVKLSIENVIETEQMFLKIRNTQGIQNQLTCIKSTKRLNHHVTVFLAGKCARTLALIWVIRTKNTKL